MTLAPDAVVTPRRILTQNPVRIGDYEPGSSFGPRLLLDYEFVWLLHGPARLTTEVPSGWGEKLRSLTRLLRPGAIALTRRGERDHYEWATTRPSRHACSTSS